MYLPKRRWTDDFTGKVKEGGRWYSETCDYFTLPLYVRENTILPTGDTEDRSALQQIVNLKESVLLLTETAGASCGCANLIVSNNRFCYN